MGAVQVEQNGFYFRKGNLKVVAADGWNTDSVSFPSTTHTSTGTSTITTTRTSTATTLPMGKVGCANVPGDPNGYVTITNAQDCGYQSAAINSILEGCPKEYGAVSCHGLSDGTALLSVDGGSAVCRKTAAALSDVIREYTGPLGSTVATIHCASFRHLYLGSASACGTAAAVLNQIFDEHLAGTFHNCSVTTQTSTVRM